MFLLMAVLLASNSLVLLCPASAHAQGGVPLWTNYYNGPANGDDNARAITVDSDGNVFVTGSSQGVGFFDDYYATIKYSNAGIPLWTNLYHGKGGGSAIAVDRSGDVVVTGTSGTSLDSSGPDYATIKYSSTGVPLWANRYVALDHF